MLRVDKVRKAFQGFQAVAEANLTVPAGSVTAVIGPNGAGKSTLFNLITGQIQVDAGKIVFQGEDIVGLPAHAITHKGIGRSFQLINIFPRLTVLENVKSALIAREGKTMNVFLPVRKIFNEEAQSILQEFGLAAFAEKSAGMMSYGDQKVLEIAIALAIKPKLLLLDEPTAGMSPEETRKIVQLIKRLVHDHGVTILLTEHDMDLVFDVAQRIMVLHQGRTIAEGLPEEVRRDVEVKRAYLGETHREDVGNFG